MFTAEIKQTVYIAISAIILALVLGLLSVLMDMRNDLATIRNSQIQSAKAMQEYRKFNKYDDKEVNGADVIEAIREYYDSEIGICVSKGIIGTSEFYMTKEEMKLNGVPVLRSNYDDVIGIDKLQARFTANRTFKAYLAYDFADLEEIVDLPFKGDVVTGVVFVEE